ncbi:MAG: helix-turn-helix domain-containing protein [Alphaproteobacteria bacterium]|nr:helix-turn-helix domain-containing protein [bacterium]MCP5083283.1 helix-turn-helix domain-containing protein [Alphaproteobacteria bacterium]
MARRSAVIVLTPEEREGLERLCRRCSTPQALARRAQMILMAGAGVGVGETAAKLGVWRKTVSHWRGRWLAGSRSSAPVEERLSDAPRSGAPARITAEQICSIVALACEPPSESGLPVTHWSQQELADEAMRRGIVEQISQRSVGRFLKRSRP